LFNNVFWQNRAFYIGVGGIGAGNQNQQNVVALYNAFTTNRVASEPTAEATTPNGGGVVITGGTGACVSGTSYWDIGVRGDTNPGNHAGGTLSPMFSILTNASEVGAGSNNHPAANPTVLSQYCNGSRMPPEFNSMGYQVPPGISDATVPNPIFNLMPAATVDEGNNWINISWGPLEMANDSAIGGSNGNYGGGGSLGNYGLATGSPAINQINPANLVAYGLAPNTDFYGNGRKGNLNSDTSVDIGAVELVPPPAKLAVTPTSLDFGNTTPVGGTSAAQTLTLANTGGSSGTGITVAVTAPFSRPTGTAGGTCGATLGTGATCTINIVFRPTTTTLVTGTVTITANVPVTGSPVGLSGTGAAQTHTASVSPSPLAFGNWATGTASNPMLLTVTNTGNSALAGGTFTFGGGTPQTYSRVTTGTFPTGAPNCAATLAVGASCTIKVVFTVPSGLTTQTTYNRTLTVAYTGATVTPSPVSLTGTGVLARSNVSITPNPLTITLPSGTLTGSANVTFTNTSAAGSSSVAVTSVNVSGAGLIWSFTKGTDNCTGTNLAPGGTCTVQVTFGRIGSVGTHTGSISFTDTATGSPQSGTLTGVAQ
jgi:hypothetical protein